MKKCVENVLIIIILALPCGVMLTDSWFLRFIGVVYTVEYVRNIIRPLYRAYLRMKDLRNE